MACSSVHFTFTFTFTFTNTPKHSMKPIQFPCTFCTPRGNCKQILGHTQNTIIIDNAWEGELGPYTALTLALHEMSGWFQT